MRDPEGLPLAVMTIEEIFTPDKAPEAELVYRTLDTEHPGVDYLINRSGVPCIAGPLEGFRLPIHYDFKPLRLTPAELRSDFADLGWTRIVAFQTRNPMHRAHQELTLRAAEQVNANL